MAKSCMVASLVTCQNLMIILARFWSGHHGQILPGVTCHNLMIILARFWSGHHGQILHGSITNDLSEPYDNLGKILVRSPWPNRMVASLVIYQYLMIILARFWSGHHGQILHGSITNDLSEPYDNLGKILVRSPWPNRMVASLVIYQYLMIILARFWSGHHGQILHGSITSDLSVPYDNLGKILVRSPWPNLAW